MKKALIKKKRLFKFYSNEENILDIGSGNCGLNLLIKNAGYQITSLDIVNKSVFEDIQPIIYEGQKLPFKDKEFEVVQLITVLHHIKEPEKNIAEALRVGKKLIIMEDIYENELQKYLTFTADSINNWEFLGHPHTNKSDAEWRKLFKNMGLKVVKAEYYDFLIFFKQVTYILI